MSEITVLDNPRGRRRRSRRKMSAAVKALLRSRRRKNPTKSKRRKATKRPALPKGLRHRPVFYGSEGSVGVRSPFKKLNPHTKGTTMKHRKTHRRRRSNPPAFNIKGAVGGATRGLKTAAVGALAIAVNKALSNQVAKMVGVDQKKRALVEVATALVVLPMAARAIKMPALAGAASVAASVAIYDTARQYLPTSVQSYLGDWGFPANIPAPATVAGFLPAAVDADSGESYVDPGMSMIPGAQY